MKFQNILKRWFSASLRTSPPPNMLFIHLNFDILYNIKKSPLLPLLGVQKINYFNQLNAEISCSMRYSPIEIHKNRQLLYGYKIVCHVVSYFLHFRASRKCVGWSLPVWSSCNSLVQRPMSVSGAYLYRSCWRWRRVFQDFRPCTLLDLLCIL